ITCRRRHHAWVAEVTLRRTVRASTVLSVIGRFLARHWTVPTAVAVVALAAFAVYRLQGAYTAGHPSKSAIGAADQIVPFNPKRVTLEVFGPPGATATISYLDINASPKRVENAPLPWVYQDTTTTPAVATNIQAQGDGKTLGCRITIDGVVKVEQSYEGADAYVFCLDKSG
ncbi:MAG TPA: MmpS family transport accessory protein, partial [Mycobacterium sp.]|nr:MmpS family transport accessory protein [Mycobacterium sp.]